jgi:undecaprenyl-phosphate galactose phosphotransferase
MAKKRLATLLLFFSDIITVSLSLQISISLRKTVLSRFPQFPELPAIDISFFWWVFPVWIFFLAYEGLYSKRFSFWDEVKMLWKVSFFSTLGVFSILYLGKFGEQVSRTVLVTMGLITLPLFPLVRINIKKLLRIIGLMKSKVLILGAGSTGRLILSALKRDANLGYNVVGFLDDDQDKIGSRIDGIKIHAGVDKAEKYIGRCGIEDIVIAMPGCKKEKFLALIHKLQHKTQNILLIPDLFGITALGTNLQHFFQEQAIGLEVKNNLARPFNRFTKRVFDIIVSTILIILLALPMLILSILIRLNSKGPAIYAQERIGKNNRTFMCYKFRTMYSDAESRLKDLLSQDSMINGEWAEYSKLKDDPRITKIGKFLRMTSLDELPQIFNVIKGEMSLVGPRPIPLYEGARYKDMLMFCFSVLPGISGLWQVSGRNNLTYDHRVALDAWYVRNWNLWLDIVILFKTIKVVLKKEGAS